MDKLTLFKDGIIEMRNEILSNNKEILELDDNEEITEEQAVTLMNIQAYIDVSNKILELIDKLEKE